MARKPRTRPPVEGSVTFGSTATVGASGGGRHEGLTAARPEQNCPVRKHHVTELHPLKACPQWGKGERLQEVGLEKQAVPFLWEL